MGDAGVGQHALEACLVQRSQVAQRHGEHGDDGERHAPRFLIGGHGDEQNAQEGGEAGRLGGGAHEGRDGRGRALVDVRRPHVEGDEADLEAEADDQKRQAEVEQIEVGLDRRQETGQSRRIGSFRRRHR